MGCLARLRMKKGKLIFLVCLCTLIVLLLGSLPWKKPAPVSLPHESHTMRMVILPSLSVVPEGTTTLIMCLVSDGVNVYVETPSLPDPLRSSVHTSTHEGGVLLTIERATAGHSGVYTCHAIGSMGVERTQTVELKVMAGDGSQEQATLSTSHSLHSSAPSSHTLEKSSSTPTSHTSQSTTPPPISHSPPLPSSTHLSQSAPSFSISHMSPISVPPSSVSKHFIGATQERNNRLVASTDTASGPSSVSFDWAQQGKFQKAQVDKFCLKHNLQHLNHSVPKGIAGIYNQVFAFNRHMLLDQEHEVLFCFVPKVGCTNLKLLFFVAQGDIPRSELSKSRDRVNQIALEKAMGKHSFMYRDNDTKAAILRSYFKFVMFRNPLERLASGYRSKVERFKLVGTKPYSPPYNWLRKAIYNYTHTTLYSNWTKNSRNTPVFIEFRDFIEFWLVSRRPMFNFDEHFMFITDMCQPCRVRFDFYGSFHHFDRDAQVLISKIGANSTDLRSGYYSEDTSTETRMQQYYSTLSEEQKRQVLKKMALELEFFYTIFPEEKDRHKEILGIPDDLPEV